MHSDSKKEFISKIIALVAGTVVLFSGLIFILSWHLGWSNVLRFPPSIEVVSYESSLNIFLSGLGIIALFVPVVFPLVNISGGIILFIALWRLVDLSFNLNFGLAQIIAPHIPLSDVAAPEALMPGIIALGFLLIGNTLLVWTKNKRHPLQSILILLTSLIVFLLGLSSTFGYLVPMRYSFIWWGTPLNFYSQLNAMLIGIGLMAASVYYDSKLKQNSTRRFPIMLTILLALLAILTSWVVALEKGHIVERVIILQLDEIKTRTLTKLQGYIILLKQLSTFMELDKTHSFDSKIQEIGLYFQTLKELEAILWIDSRMLIHSIIPQDQFQKKINTPLPISHEVQRQLKEAIARKKMFLTTVHPKNNNALELFILNPIFSEKQILQGLIAFEIDLKAFFKTAFGTNAGDDFTIFISDGKQTIFSINESKNITNFKQWEMKDILHIENLNLFIDIYPTQHLLEVNINRMIIYLIVLGGSAIALTVGALTYFWQLTNFKIEEVEIIKKQLLNTKKEQVETLKSAQIGTWVWDLKTNDLRLDQYAHILFGIEPQDTVLPYQKIIKRVVPEDNEPLQLDIKKSRETGIPLDCSFRIFMPDESIHWLVSKGKVFYGRDKKPEKITGISWEITSIKKTALLLEVSEEISKVLSENAPIPETFDRIIQILYHYLNWSILVLWLMDPESEHLQLSRISHIPSIQLPAFRKATHSIKEITTATTINHVLATNRSTWFKDVTQDPNFVRSKAAKEEGIKGSFALPILAGTRIIGILELFKQSPFIDEVDNALLNLMSSIGTGVGQYIQRKSAQEAIIELAAIVTNAQDAVYGLSLDGIIKNWNLGAEKIFGWKAEEVIGKSIKFIYPSDQLVDLAGDLKRLVYGRTTVHFEIQCLRKDGSLIWVDKTIVNIKDSNDRLMSIACIDQDISREKKMRDALSESEMKFRDFVEATEEWFWEIDTQFNLIYTNPLIETILGYSVNEIIDKQILDLLPPEDQKELIDQIKNCIQIKEGWGKRTTAWLHKNGSIRWLESDAHPVIDENKQVVGFRGADRDVTERMLMEKSKNEFISMVNHELRTPLTSIIGALGLMRSTISLGDKLKDLVEIAYRNSERLADIINDILDIEKIELGKLEFELKPASLLELIDESIAASKPMAVEFAIHIVKEGTLSDVKILVDHRRLIQVLMNLISNAIKFSPEHSTIFISTKVFDNKVRVSVRDQGPGISEEFKPRIFEKFAQADIADSRKLPGTGLGLSICKNLIEGMNGTIAFISKQSEGTIFYFDLPFLKDQNE